LISVSGFDRYVTRYKSTFLRSAEKALTSKQVILGPIVEEFEKEFARYLDVSFACAVNSGTDALKLAVRVLDLSHGKLLSVSNAGPYASIAAVENDLEPIFCDVDFQSRLVNPESLYATLDQCTDIKVVVITHLFGNPVENIEEIVSDLHRRKIRVIEDCSQAHGAHIGGRKVGTFGDLAVFSFYPTKNLGAFGDAGIVVTNSSSLAEKARSLRQYGWGERYFVKYPQGMNSRLDAIQAAYLLEVLPELDSWNTSRQGVAATYQNTISHPFVEKPFCSPGSVFHLFTVTCQRRSDLVEHLKKSGIESVIHYPTLDHHRFSHGLVSLPNSERLCDSILSIPCHPFMSMDEAMFIAHTINSFS
jgi:aminotransferase EvaB